MRTIDARALAALEGYAWPGNVRELRNVIERAVVLAEGTAITLDDLTDRLRGSARTVAEGAGVDAGDLPGDYKEHVRRYEAELILRALHKHTATRPRWRGR